MQTYLIIAPKINPDEGEPDDAGCVHCEADKLGFVEVLGNVASFDGVERAHGDEESNEAERNGDTSRCDAADEADAVAREVDQLRIGWFEDEHDGDDGAFDPDDDESDDELRRRTHEARLPRHYLLLTSGQDSSDAIGPRHESAVDHAEGQPGQDAAEVARDESWFGDERK